ncbi:MAG TPA: hypothetical protein VNU93_09260, partial [Verrucomicrobiae bacterium]|nr:hypothetical protein [Verrucomicrobiae bacterium]
CQIPTLLTLPFQLGIISIGLWSLVAFGASIVVNPPTFNMAGLRVSLFDIFVVSIIVLLLFALRC